MALGLSRSGKGIGETILAWLADPDFRHEVERISAERLATAEHKLVDLLLTELDREDGGKTALSIWGHLKDDRRRASASAAVPKPASRRARHVVSPERAAAAQRAAARAAEFRQLLEVIQSRLAAAESATEADK